MSDTIVITILVLIAVGLLFALAARNTKKITLSKKKKLLDDLHSLKEGTESEDDSNRRDTIIKLDNLLSKALQYRLGNKNMCGDNLKLAKKYFNKDQYNSIWEIHKLRNNIVHDDREISLDEADHAYDIYKMSINKILK